MSFKEKMDRFTYSIEKSQQAAAAPMERFRAEIDFAEHFAEAIPDRTELWRELILKATGLVAESAGKAGDTQRAVHKAEEILAPIGKAAKEYRVHAVGHAHIDMNWMWPWQETVSVSHDTFATVNTLMEEFPEFRFSQSQASTYIAMEQVLSGDLRDDRETHQGRQMGGYRQHLGRGGQEHVFRRIAVPAPAPNAPVFQAKNGPQTGAGQDRLGAGYIRSRLYGTIDSGPWRGQPLLLPPHGSRALA